MSSTTPRDYVVTIEITTMDKEPWEEILDVSAYEIGEALMTVSIRMSYLHGEKVKLRVKDAQPKPLHLGALLAETIGQLKLNRFEPRDKTPNKAPKEDK